MDQLTLFGLLAVTAMLVFYALEDRSPWFILAFAGACVLASIYGFLQGAWPFGVVEAIWAGVAVYRWRIRTLSKTGRANNPRSRAREHASRAISGQGRAYSTPRVDRF